MRHAGGWIEVRSTEAGVLEGLPLPYGRPRRRANRFGRVYNVVVDANARNAKVRRIPGLYNCSTLVYSDRDLENVRSQLVKRLTKSDLATEVPTYAMNACRIGEHYGLYVRDTHNRSAYRRKLMRRGVEFADDPFVTFEGRFSCEDWGPFSCSFAIFNADAEDAEVVPTSGALLAFNIATFRVGAAGEAELNSLVQALAGCTGASSSDPEGLVAFLRDRLGTNAPPAI